MKRLFYLIAIIGIPLIAYFQFENYRALHAPEEYTLPPNPDIDEDYHDPEQVLSYYSLLQEAKSYAGYCWAAYRLNVKTTDPIDPEYSEQMKRYHQYLAAAQHIEKKLVKSAQLKKQGHSNESIQNIEKGLSTNGSERFIGKLSQMVSDSEIIASKGDRSYLVFEAQKMLDSLGYKMPIDGFFSIETEGGLKNFQSAEKIFPSGKIDHITFRTLLSRFSVN